MGVTDNLTGLEAFTFDYEVKWPVSLVISRSSLKRYELLFRHLFKCRLTERVCARVPHSDAMLSDRDINALCLQVLTNTWLDDQYCKEIIQLSDASRVSAVLLNVRGSSLNLTLFAQSSARILRMVVGLSNMPWRLGR
jgi:hypothetical protein